jgi:HTH-type transcriptional regulator / antitoxin HigA
MNTMTRAVATEYGKLLAEEKPEIIQDDRQNDAYIRRLEGLTGKARVTPAEEKLIALLTLLIEEYEEKHYAIPEASPLDVVRHLMDANGLRQKDLLDVFGTESVASEVLNGKRDLAKEHIRRLSDRFHVSPAVFF